MTEPLTQIEELAFAGLARTLVRLDGVFSPEEAEALLPLLTVVLTFPNTTPREIDAPLTEAETKRGVELLDRSARELPTEEAVRAAAQEIVRPEVRQLFYDALFELAAVDSVSTSEDSLLHWLRELWHL